MKSLLVARRVPRRPEMDDVEIEAHIISCTQQMEEAYLSFLFFHRQEDREAAIAFMHLRDDAILTRSEAVQAARHDAFEQALDDGLDYFAVMGARHSQELREARAHA